MTPIVHYLSSGELPDDRIEACRIQVQAVGFSLVNGQLNKQSLDGSYLKCVTTQQRQYILAKLHEEICENHPSDRTLVTRPINVAPPDPTVEPDPGTWTTKSIYL